MSHVDYVVVSNIIGDDLTLADGTEHIGLLGGAATYAAAGISLWSERVGVLSGVGADFETLYGEWFGRCGIDKAGLQVRDPHTPRAWIHYQSPDSRTETPQFGMDHFRLMELRMADLPSEYRDAHGWYLFRDADIEFWNGVFEHRKDQLITVIWEVHAGVANAANWQQVSDILSRIDLFSINLTEARLMCNLTNAEQIMDRLLSTGVKGVALRAGSDGAFVADSQSLWSIPSYPVQVIDVTGAGNAFTGGFLTGYCESGGDIAEAGLRGAVSASFMLEQFGPPPHINATSRQIAARLKERLQPVRLR